MNDRLEYFEAGIILLLSAGLVCFYFQVYSFAWIGWIGVLYLICKFGMYGFVNGLQKSVKERGSK